MKLNIATINRINLNNLSTETQGALFTFLDQSKVPLEYVSTITLKRSMTGRQLVAMVNYPRGKRQESTLTIQKALFEALREKC